MELKLDAKTLVIGIALGIVATVVIGAGDMSEDNADFGIAIPSGAAEGAALVKTVDDALYIINPRSGMAIRVLQAGIKSDYTDRRESRGRPFFLSSRESSKSSGN
ncbi:MAG: hypothetical protein PHY02_02900 [Phycisphaerae bacterium]|nr:hypothetical protein [Phycisphaerae bacterium]